MKEKTYKTLAVIALIVAVTGLSIAYAAYSETLTINGSAKVVASQWDIHFENLAESIVSNNGVSLSDPEFETDEVTKITGFKAQLTAPGDSVTYKFDVVNDGTLAAKLSSFTAGQITACTADPESDPVATNGEVQAVCADLTYTLTYEDGTEIKVNDELSGGTSKKLKLTVAWDENSKAETSGNIDVTLGETILIYTQK